MRSMMARLQADGQRGEDEVFAACRRKRSTSWVTRSAGATRRRRAGLYLGTRPMQKKVQQTLRSRSASRPSRRFSATGARGIGGPTEPPYARMGELLLSGSASAKPIVPWIATPRDGCASGCVRNTRVRVGISSESPTSISTTNWDLYRLLELHATSRGRKHETCQTILVREPDAGKPPVRFDEREVETARTAPPLDSTRVGKAARCRFYVSAIPFRKSECSNLPEFRRPTEARRSLPVRFDGGNRRSRSAARPERLREDDDFANGGGTCRTDAGPDHGRQS